MSSFTNLNLRKANTLINVKAIMTIKFTEVSEFSQLCDVHRWAFRYDCQCTDVTFLITATVNHYHYFKVRPCVGLEIPQMKLIWEPDNIYNPQAIKVAKTQRDTRG